MKDRVIGRVRFLDGADRDVFQQPDGRQYVIGHDGEHVGGVWIQTDDAEADAPVIVPASR